MQPQCMPQTFYIASRTARIKGFTVKSSCSQHRTDHHRLPLTASMYFMSSYTPVFKTKEKTVYWDYFSACLLCFLHSVPCWFYSSQNKKCKWTTWIR